MFFNKWHYAFSFVFVALFIVVAFSVYQWRNSAYFVFSNGASGDVHIKINNNDYLIDNRYELVGFVFPLSGRAKVEVVKSGLSDLDSNYCEVVNKPFGQCAFQVVISKEGFFCTPCFSL